MPTTEVLFVGDREMDRATHLSQWFLPEGHRYENLVVRDSYSEDAFIWAVNAASVDEFASFMAALWALTGCRMPRDVRKRGTDVYIGYCDAAGESVVAAVATHIGWTLISGVAGIAESGIDGTGIAEAPDTPDEESAGGAA